MHFLLNVLKIMYTLFLFIINKLPKNDYMFQPFFRCCHGCVFVDGESLDSNDDHNNEPQGDGHNQQDHRGERNQQPQFHTLDDLIDVSN